MILTDTATHIKNLNVKLQQLLKQYASLQAENARQKKILDSLQETTNEQKIQLELLHQKNLVLKVSSDTADSKEKKELEQKINGYLRNIEKCISLLSHKQNV